MIVRVLVVDPVFPDNILVYQVPENSRAYQVLVETFKTADLEFTTLRSTRKPKETKK